MVSRPCQIRGCGDRLRWLGKEHVTVLVEVWPLWLKSDNSRKPWYYWSVSKNATIPCDRHGWNGKTWSTFLGVKSLFYAGSGRKREGGHVTITVEIFVPCDRHGWNACDHFGWNDELSTKYPQDINRLFHKISTNFPQIYPQQYNTVIHVIWVISSNSSYHSQ